MLGSGSGERTLVREDKEKQASRGAGCVGSRNPAGKYWTPGSGGTSCDTGEREGAGKISQGTSPFHPLTQGWVCP